MGKEMRRKKKQMTPNINKNSKIFGYSKLKSYFRLRKLLNFEIMGTIGVIYIILFFASIPLSFFLAKTHNPGYVLVCMVLCCLLTPFIGFPFIVIG